MVVLKIQVIWEVALCSQANSSCHFLWLVHDSEAEGTVVFRTGRDCSLICTGLCPRIFSITILKQSAAFVSCAEGCGSRLSRSIGEYVPDCGVIPEDTIFHSHCCENIKTHIKICICVVILCLGLWTVKMGDDDDFTPRPYQEQLMNMVKDQNTIIYLPTGSGKTFIAVMLIKEMSASLDRWVISFQFLNGFLLD